MSGNSGGPLVFTVLPWFNKWITKADGTGKWEKVPALRKGFKFKPGECTFAYGTVTQPDWTPDNGHPVQQGFVCGPDVGLLVVDVDTPEEYATTEIATVLGRDDAMSTRDDHFHVGLDCRHLSAPDWPQLGNLAGGDIKALGFVAAPGSVHYSGARYEPGFEADGVTIHLVRGTSEHLAMLRRDRAAFAERRKAEAAAKRATGGQVAPANGARDDLDHDTSQAGLCLKLVLAGLSDEAIRAEWDKSAAHDRSDCDEPGSMGDAEFERHLGSARGSTAAVERAGRIVRDEAMLTIVGASPEAIAAPVASQNGSGPPPAGQAVEAAVEMPGLNLPDAFWAALPVLGHIRTAAWNRCGSADAVLHAVLARVAAMWPPSLRLKTGIAPASANYYTCLCGPPGTGKSIASDVAVELLPKLARYPGLACLPDDSAQFADSMPLGSGEGLAELFFTTRLEDPPGGKGKPRTVKVKTKDHAFVFADEGEKMAKMLERAGATIGEALRSAWMGATIGQANASVETTRVLPKGTYSLGLVIGFQPATIGPLLADAASGTPQRFTYAASQDPAIPEIAPEWPGELALHWPPGLVITGSLLPFAPEVQQEVRAARLARMHGQEAPPYAEHGMLTRAKMAALLAVLDGRPSVDAQLWQLSKVLWDTSCAVRDSMLAYGARQAAGAEWHLRQTMAGRQVEVEGATDAARHGRTLARAARSAGRHVHKDACGGCTRTCVNRTMASGYRKLVTTDEVIAALLEAGVIVADGDGFKAGPEGPG